MYMYNDTIICANVNIIHEIYMQLELYVHSETTKLD